MTRLEKLMDLLPSGVDGALITTAVNRRYYTGFASSAGTVLATRQGCYLIIDSRYFEAAGNAVKSCEVLLQSSLYGQLNDLLVRHNVQTLAIENQKTSLRAFDALQNELDVQLVADDFLSDAINQQRCVKSKEEIDAVLAAQKISDDTFTHILNFIKPGKTEREIALEMEFFSRKNGSEGASFDFIVVSGSNSSLPHGVPSDKAVEAGDFITMDFGSIVDGYHSDMTRTIAVGHASEEQEKVYDTVLKAQLAACDAVKAGIPCNTVDKVARDIIDSAGYGDYFGHGLGHSLGLEIHEDPRFNTVDTTITQTGMVMSVEPGIYLPGQFGVRIEDIVAVTDDGCDNLVTSTKELVVL